MEENLVGFLLDALEPAERREVERCLAQQPAARAQLEVLRRALAPLDLDRDLIEPPAGLAERTLARAEELADAPRLRLHMPAPARTWWRRSDLLVAASLLLGALLLIPPGISYVRYRADITACQNNLRDFYGALQGYSNAHGQLPDVTAVRAPVNVAGLVVPVLLEEMRDAPGAGFRELHVTCPGNADAGAARGARGLTVKDFERMTPQEFEAYASELLGSYAYSLGYREADNSYRVYRFDEGLAGLPVMSDRPPLRIFAGDRGNSPNHWGKGQNVLYGDGHCTFCANRNVGVGLDDIYTNADGAVAAGRHRSDAVLGESRAKP